MLSYLPILNKQKVSSADAMPDAKIVFGKAYSNSVAQFDKLANSLDRAGNKLYNEIENTLGEDAQPFINGLCEDLLDDIADDLSKSGKSSAIAIEDKILSFFEDAEKIVQEYADSNNVKNSVDINSSWDGTSSTVKQYSLPKNIEVINGFVGGKIPVDEYQKLRQFSIKNPMAKSVTFGKYFSDTDSYIAKAGKDSSYFDMGSTVWAETADKYDLSDDEMFEYFNVPFLDDVIASKKAIRFSHNPINYSGSFLTREWNYFKERLNITDNNLFKEGDFWYVR